MVQFGLVGNELSRAHAVSSTGPNLSREGKAKRWVRLILTTFVLTWASFDLVSIVCHDVIFAQILFDYFHSG
ncbi:MAG: hypothetical protein AAF438_10510 [Pseudomonadota bacterium]